jgi:hypothetical protein
LQPQNTTWVGGLGCLLFFSLLLNPFFSRLVVISIIKFQYLYLHGIVFIFLN